MMIFVEDAVALRLPHRSTKADRVTARMMDILLPSFLLGRS
jgi:hypothetical protein